MTKINSNDGNNVRIPASEPQSQPAQPQPPSTPTQPVVSGGDPGAPTDQVNVNRGNGQQRDDVGSQMPTPKPKVKLDPEGVRQGKDLARQMHEQTTSRVANNKKVNEVLQQIDADNAYTFFSEYRTLARRDDSPSTTGVMHDAHDLVEGITSVDNSDTYPALDALLSQADELGLGNSIECKRLRSLMQQHKDDKATIGGILLPAGSRRAFNDDITAATGREFDAAIRNLLKAMGTRIR